MTDFDKKVIENFPGKIVRKDLTSLMKKGANVPTYVLEYLLGMYCATDDEDAIADAGYTVYEPDNFNINDIAIINIRFASSVNRSFYNI